MLVIPCVIWSWLLDFDGSGYCVLQASSEDLIKDIVGQTSGFMPRDMHALIADVGESLIPRKSIQSDKDGPPELDNKACDDASGVLCKEDLAKALERSKKRNASALGTPKVNIQALVTQSLK